MFCPKCKADHFSQDGTVNGRSQYSCAVCGFNLTIPDLPDSENADKKREALILYFAGYCIEDIVLLTGLGEGLVADLIEGLSAE